MDESLERIICQALEEARAKGRDYLTRPSWQCGQLKLTRQRPSARNPDSRAAPKRASLPGAEATDGGIVLVDSALNFAAVSTEYEEQRLCVTSGVPLPK